MGHDPGVGATDALSLRISVATLVRVLFKSPDSELMLALERKATLRESERGRAVEVRSQPFGGAVRILDLNRLGELVGDFHFDGERSRTERDFRIFIRPSTWPVLREFCVRHLSRVDDPFLETDPTRELIEEFTGALKMSVEPGQYAWNPIATLVEQEPAPTENFYARGALTARVYRVCEVSITDFSLAHALWKNSESMSDGRLSDLALQDSARGGPGWGSAILAMPWNYVEDSFRALPPAERSLPLILAGHQLDETVSAILEGIALPRYQRW